VCVLWSVKITLNLHTKKSQNLSTRCVRNRPVVSLSTMLLFHQVATRLSLTTCQQIVEIVELQDDNKLLEQLVTMLLFYQF
jgi:hypothetical protein